MKLQLLQNTQLALYWKVPKYGLYLKLFMLCHQQDLPLPAPPALSLPQAACVEAPSPNRNHSYCCKIKQAIQPCAESSSTAQNHILHHMRRTKKERKKEMEKTAVRAINVSWNLSHPCYNWQDKKDTVIKIQITGYCLGVLYIKILGWITALQKYVYLSLFFTSVSQERPNTSASATRACVAHVVQFVALWGKVFVILQEGDCGARGTCTLQGYFFPLVTKKC